MSEMTVITLLFIVGAVAGFINVNAGGGSSLTLPLLIFLGLDGALANGTNRVGILIQNMFAVSSFKQQNVSDFKESFILSLFTLPGAILGALVSTKINDIWFQRILGIVMIGIVITMFIPKKKQSELNEELARKRRWMMYPVLLGIGFYGGFIQVGVGFLFMSSLYHLLQLSLVHVNMHKVFIVFIYTIPSLLVFMFTGNVNWTYGIILAGGMAIGAWWGARASVKGGEKFIRYILAFAMVIMSIKLLGML
ncbi:sulfite exporter TauE/SafE family protein [candidate division KSB1 bacterium]|nr:sulfite exporter TauE/SafE family protein [candidate division KSB1 bacterium]